MTIVSIEKDVQELIVKPNGNGIEMEPLMRASVGASATADSSDPAAALSRATTTSSEIVNT